MRKKLTQDYVSKTCQELGYILLSPYVNAKTKIMVKSNTTKKVYKTLFHSLKQGHKPEEKNTRITQDYAEAVCEAMGYTLLSQYVNARTKLVIKSKQTGNSYSVLFDSIKRGHNPDNAVHKLSQTEYISLFTQEGYQPLITDYSNITVLVPINVTCPNNHHWVVTYNNFKKGRRCPICNKQTVGGMSRGERLIFSALSGNSLRFEREKRVIINNEIHRFDFFLPDYNTMIEYDGQQHYNNSAIFPGANLANQKRRDEVKDKYCKQQGINLIRLPYTISNPHDINDFLNSKLKLIHPLKQVPLNMPYIEEVAKYYLTHMGYEASDKYLISLRTVARYFKMSYGMTKTQYIKQISKKTLR